ncbi:uL13 family ribosomal protein, partial [Patescibacteria group bacterium]
MKMKKIDRQTHKIDAENKISGRLATEIAILLMGKNKASYRPNLDAGEFVEVNNADKLKFTGNKMDQKKYYHYSGYQGGL